MRLSVGEARDLVARVMQAKGQSADYAALTADHIIDCELRGLAYGGLARVVSIVERLDRSGPPARPVEIGHETPVSARVAGNDNLGYVVGHRATEVAIRKAKASGISIVGADGTWYTGMLSYYAEMAAAEGLVSSIASNTTAWVAPHGAVEARFGTNPMCFGFPAEGDPVIWDIGTSNIIHAEVMLARRLGQEIDEGLAYDGEGRPTRDPDAALGGAFTAWGGHRGSGLGHVVQLLGALAGSAVAPPDLADFGFVIQLTRPDLLGDAAEFRAKVTAYAEWVRAARPVPDGATVRMPFDRSAAERRRRLAADAIEVPDLVHARLVAVAG